MFPSPVPPGQNMSAMREWQLLVNQIGSTAEALIDQMSRPDRVWEKNSLLQLIANTPAGQRVGDSTMVREQALAVKRMLECFVIWLNTELQTAEGQPLGLTPLDILSHRTS